MEELFISYVVYFDDGSQAMANGTVKVQQGKRLTMGDISEIQRDLQKRFTDQLMKVNNILILNFQRMNIGGCKCQSSS